MYMLAFQQKGHCFIEIEIVAEWRGGKKINRAEFRPRKQ